MAGFEVITEAQGGLCTGNYSIRSVDTYLNMTNRGTGEDLARVNLVLSRANSEFLDRLRQEIDKRTGAKVSRSEIVRASITGLAALHRIAPLATCKNETDLAVMMVLAIRSAITGGSTTL
jgi:hypothetical protein